jgi:tetratricopeptide (TPR) repeat protein
MRKTTTFSTILVLVALLAAHMAWAGPTENSDREAARIATKQATAAYNLGHYDEAASLYEESYTRVPDPILLYDLGQSYRQANKLDKALIAYRSYLRTVPEDAPNRERVKQWVAELEWTSDLQNKTAALKAAQEKDRAAQVVTKPADPDKPAEPRKAVQKPSDPTHSKPWSAQESSFLDDWDLDQKPQSALALQIAFENECAIDGALSTRFGQRLVLSAMLCESQLRKKEIGDQLQNGPTWPLMTADRKAGADVIKARERLTILDIVPLQCDVWPVERIVQCMGLLPSISCTEDDELSAQVHAFEKLTK